MTAFNEEAALSCSSCCWELVAMVETQGNSGEAVGRADCEEELEPYSYLRFDRPFPIGYSPNSLFTF